MCIINVNKVKLMERPSLLVNSCTNKLTLAVNTIFEHLISPFTCFYDQLAAITNENCRGLLIDSVKY